MALDSVLYGNSLVPSAVESSPFALDTKTPCSLVAQQLASSATSPWQSALPPAPPPPSPALPMLPLTPDDPLALLLPLVELPPASVPLVEVSPEVPALAPGALPQDAVAAQSSALLLQAESCRLLRPKPMASAEKANARIVAPVSVAVEAQNVPDKV